MIVSLLTAAALCAVTAGSAALYLLPVLVGWARRVPDLGAVAVINILLGWTLLGWGPGRCPLRAHEPPLRGPTVRRPGRDEPPFPGAVAREPAPNLQGRVIKG